MELDAAVVLCHGCCVRFPWQDCNEVEVKEAWVVGIHSAGRVGARVVWVAVVGSFVLDYAFGCAVMRLLIYVYLSAVFFWIIIDSVLAEYAFRLCRWH